MKPNALCFGTGCPGSGLPCHVSVGPAGVEVDFDGGGGDVPDKDMISFERLSVAAGGLHHDHLVVAWGADPMKHTLYVKDAEFISLFRAVAPSSLTRDLEAAAATVRRMRARHRLTWILAVAGVAAIGLLLWLGSDLLVEMAVARVPIEWEQKLGQAAYQDFLTHQTIIKKGPAVAAVTEMTERLTTQLRDSPYQFEVTIVKNDLVNAFALPGGYVVVFTGLLQKAESGEEVAGVLSHELNHVVRRHGLERIIKQLGLVTIVSIIVGTQQGMVGLMREVSVELLTLRFGRDQETEADVTGIRLLHQAKINPEGMVSFFERLSEQDKDRVELLSTHPMSRGRAGRLKAELAALPKQLPEPFTFDWKQVQQSIPGS